MDMRELRRKSGMPRNKSPALNQAVPNKNIPAERSHFSQKSRLKSYNSVVKRIRKRMALQKFKSFCIKWIHAMCKHNLTQLTNETDDMTARKHDYYPSDLNCTCCNKISDKLLNLRFPVDHKTLLNNTTAW